MITTSSDFFNAEENIQNFTQVPSAGTGTWLLAVVTIYILTLTLTLTALTLVSSRMLTPPKDSIHTKL